MRVHTVLGLKMRSSHNSNTTLWLRRLRRKPGVCMFTSRRL